MDAPPRHSRPAPVEIILDRFERLLASRHTPGGRFERFIRRSRRGLCIATAAYAVGLAAVELLLRYVGELWWPTALLLFLPRGLFLLPLLALLPLALLLSLRLAAAQALLGLVAVFGMMDYGWSVWEEPGVEALRVVSNNIGQSRHHPPHEYLLKLEPDLIAMQEANYFAYQVRRHFEEMHFMRTKEFSLLSAYPITGSGLVEELGRPEAAWFTIEYGEAEVVVYNVHFLSPRHQWSTLRGAGFIAGMFNGTGIYSSESRAEFTRLMRERREQLHILRRVLEREERPFIVAGDFNISSHGRLYREFAGGLSDTFAEEGKGFGYTLPGRSCNSLSFFGPWLRLDYIFVGGNWEILSADTEPFRASQHRAVTAELQLRKSATGE